MEGPMNVVVVGHDNKTKCAVANALYRERHCFRQFYCNKLNSVTARWFTFRGEHPRIITTPCLATPSWAVEFNILKEKEEFKNKCFVYVKDMTELRVNDMKSIEIIKQKSGEPVIVVIPYPSQKKSNAEEALNRFEKKCKTVLLNQACSFAEMTPFSKTVFNHISDLKPPTNRSDNGTTDEQQYIGNTHRDLTDFNTQIIADEPAEEEMENQISTVTVEGNGNPWYLNKVLPAIRPIIPHEDVRLTPHHWETYRRVLSYGKTLSYHTRVNVVGYLAAGKTTLVRSLQNVNLETQESMPPTECLEIDKTASRCTESDGGRIWETQPDGYERDLNYQRMANSLNSIGDLKRKEQEDAKCKTGKMTMVIANNVEHTAIGTLIESTTASSTSIASDPTTSDKSEDISTNLNDSNTASSRSDTNNPKVIALKDAAITEEHTIGSDAIDENQIKIGQISEMYGQSLLRKEYLTQVLCKAKEKPGSRRYISYWDFAGQAAYYTTHQAFMAPNSVYLLVVDLSKTLDELVEDSMEFRMHTFKQSTILDAVRFWAGSIKAFASDEGNNTAPVIVVGTHADKVNDNDKIESMFERVRDVFSESDLSCIAIDNTKSFENYEKLHQLRERILDKALGIIEKEVSAHWIDLEYKIILEKEKGKVVLEFTRLEEINRQLDEPLSNEDVFKFLEHEHCNGFLMYFNTTGVKDMVILQPALLANFINLLLRKTKELTGWNCNGIFDQKFMENAAMDDPSLDKYKNQLLKLLIHLKVVYPWEITENSSSFFMPSLLGERPKQHYRYGENCTRSPLIRISFKGKLVPPAFFHSLAVSCMFAWKLDYETTGKGKTIWQVFYHYSRLKLSESGGTLLEMYWSDCQIFVQFLHISKITKFHRSDFLQYLSTIEHKMLDILKTYRHGDIKSNAEIACPNEGHTSFLQLDNLIKYNEARCSWENVVHMVTDEEAFSSWTEAEGSGYNTSYVTTQDILPEATRNRIINDIEVVKLSRRIGDHYLEMFMLLSIDLVTIQHALTCTNRIVGHTIIHLFGKWKSKMADEATVGNFLKVLPDLGINERLMWEVFHPGN